VGLHGAYDAFLYYRKVFETPARFLIDNMLHIGAREVAETNSNGDERSKLLW
jgi:hypothetical protein